MAIRQRREDYVSRTLDDAVIRDGLSAISRLKDSERRYAVMGGIATQSYLPTICRRPTIDIDVLIEGVTNREAFVKFVEPTQDYFRDKGYTTSFNRREFSWNFSARSPSDEAILMEFSRFSQSFYPVKKSLVERELDNRRTKFIEGREDSYCVLAPEDIAVPKIGRLITVLEENPNFDKYIEPFTKPMSTETIRYALNKTRDVKERVALTPEEVKDFLAGRFISDAYDVRMLGEQVGFDSDYFNKVVGSWKEVAAPSEAKSVVWKILPWKVKVSTN
ncbi:hypothetical protein HYT56_03645 [Candidatus Woesearchaeota archaeon]|nr:hypothetical protein [Candidatus Woesearchaeota archaeon]